jgi:hypothetical protein
VLETIPIAPSSSKTPHGRGFFSGHRALKIVLFRTTAMIERPIEERRLPLASHGRVTNPIRCVSSFTKINVPMLMRYYWHCNLSNPPSHHRLPCSPCPPMTQSRSDTRMRHSMPSFDIFSSRHLNLAVRGKIDDRNHHD